MSKPEYLLSVIVPTFNNPQYINPMVQSMVKTGHLGSGMLELIIVNNGKQPCAAEFANIPNLRVIEAGQNLGWEGGLELGLKYSTSKFVCFQNDDVFLPVTSNNFYENLLTAMLDHKVGAVGPITTVAAGLQSIYNPNSPQSIKTVRWLIGFCMLLRRATLDEVGGVDTKLPGGDDFDISIRLRNAGYTLKIQPQSFIIHHGFKTGIRVNGDQNVDGGWNSPQMQERTNKGLIQKHGFKAFFGAMFFQSEEEIFEVVEDKGINAIGTLDREYDGDCTTIPLNSQLVEAD